jgi:hypothetical protein
MRSEITMDVLNKANTEIGKLFAAYQEKINKTFSDELSVSISLPVKIDMGEDEIIVRSGINFVESRVKDENTISINPNQKQLFPES